LAFRVLADRLEHGEDIPEIHGVFAVHEWIGQHLKPIAFSLLFFESAGPSNANLEPHTACCNVADDQISCSHFTSKRRLGLVCSHASANELVSAQTIFSAGGRCPTRRCTGCGAGERQNPLGRPNRAASDGKISLHLWAEHSWSFFSLFSLSRQRQPSHNRKPPLPSWFPCSSPAPARLAPFGTLNWQSWTTPSNRWRPYHISTSARFPKVASLPSQRTLRLHSLLVPRTAPRASGFPRVFFTASVLTNCLRPFCRSESSTRASRPRTTERRSQSSPRKPFGKRSCSSWMFPWIRPFEPRSAFTPCLTKFPRFGFGHFKNLRRSSARRNAHLFSSLTVSFR